MSTAYGVNYTAALVTVPNSKVHASKWKSRLTYYTDTYEASTLAAASSIYMFRPPAGARWVGMGALYTDALGSDVTLAVGTGVTLAAAVAVTDKFLAATSHAAATKTALGPIATIDARGYEFDGGTDVIITTAGAVATGTITLEMVFAVAA